MQLFPRDHPEIVLTEDGLYRGRERLFLLKEYDTGRNSPAFAFLDREGEPQMTVFFYAYPLTLKQTKVRLGFPQLGRALEALRPLDVTLAAVLAPLLRDGVIVDDVVIVEGLAKYARDNELILRVDRHEYVRTRERRDKCRSCAKVFRVCPSAGELCARQFHICSHDYKERRAAMRANVWPCGQIGTDARQRH